MRYRSWRAWDPAPTPRHELYQSLSKILRKLSDGAQREVVEDVATWAGAANECRPEHRTLSDRELAALVRNGLVEIGAHTVTHPELSALPEAAQHREIADSRAALERIVGEPVRSFAYPYGDRSPATASIVSRLQFASAVTTDAGVVYNRSPRFELPRTIVEDVDGERFTEWLLARQFAAA
jgi:peptidoglycan/xylan/chitin deacetylase (PgdA/CDA1 family)